MTLRRVFDDIADLKNISPLIGGGDEGDKRRPDPNSAQGRAERAAQAARRDSAQAAAFAAHFGS